MLKVRISGYYKNGKDKKSYNDVAVTLPDCPDDRILGHIVNRVVPVKFTDYNERGKCYIDNVEKDDKLKASYEGKGIKEMSDKELQELAIAFDLLEIPLYRSCSLAEVRRKAYRAYSNKVLGTELDVSFDYTNASDIVVGAKKKTAKLIED